MIAMVAAKRGKRVIRAINPPRARPAASDPGRGLWVSGTIHHSARHSCCIDQTWLPSVKPPRQQPCATRYRRSRVQAPAHAECRNARHGWPDPLVRDRGRRFRFVRPAETQQVEADAGELFSSRETSGRHPGRRSEPAGSTTSDRLAAAAAHEDPVPPPTVQTALSSSSYCTPSSPSCSAPICWQYPRV